MNMDQYPFPPFGNSRNVLSSGHFHPNADRACEACNKKKTKCDKELPICGLCSRTNHDCVYPTSRKRPSRQDPVAKAKIQKINGNIDRLLEILETNPGSDADVSRTDQREEAPTKTSRQSNNAYVNTNASASLATPTHTPPALESGQCDFQRSSREVTNSSSLIPSHELAMHLLDVYFDKVQPWLGIFHKPTFMRWSETVLSKGSNALAGLGPLETMIFNGMFAFAARFSDLSIFATIIPRDRGEPFGKEAMKCLRVVEDIEEPSISILQACLLLALYHYGSGRSQRGRTVALLCIRVCYDLRLHEIDDGEEDEELSDAEWIDLETQRRLFWTTWECDLFGSILKRRPFGIDWRHIRVKMPIDDEDWYKVQRVQSSKFIPGPECWKTLSGSPNQAGRAWTLLAKSMVGWLCDMALLKNGVTQEQKAGLENNLTCFRLAMPDSYSLSSAQLQSPSVTFVQKGYIIASNLYICAAAFTASQLPVTDDPAVRTQKEIDSAETERYRQRSMELCQIMKKWPPECLLYAPPSLACSILTFNESLIKLVPLNELDNSYRDLSNLILSKFAERWTLAALLVRIRDLTHFPEKILADYPANATLVKEYPAYFNKVYIGKDRRKKLRGTSKTNAAAATADAHASNSVNPITRTPSDLSGISQRTSPQLIEQDITASLQPPDPDLAPAPDPAPALDTTPIDNFTHSTISPDINNLGEETNIFDPATMSAFDSIDSLTGSPADFDSLFSGFLQEPLWQDYHSMNFLV